MPRPNRRVSSWLCAFLLFGLNAIISAPLWTAGYINQMGSVEGSFVAISRYILRNWNDLSWFPMWFCGMPFLRVYQPGFHVTVAAVAAISGLAPERAYHLVCALLYALGPVTLFVLCDRLTGRRGFALVAGILYSVFSPSVLFSSDIRHDLGAWNFARRFQDLVHYGDAPHVAALTLLPLAILGLDRCLKANGARAVPLTAVVLGALVVTNWTGTIGLAMAVVAYFVSRWGEIDARQIGRAAAACILGYALICPWIPPSILVSVVGAAQASDGSYFGSQHLLLLGGLIVLLAALHRLFERTRVPRELRFFLLFFVCSGVVVLGRFWGNLALLPQPTRFHPEMEMAFIGAIVLPITLVWSRFPRPLRVGLLLALAGFCGFQIRSYWLYAKTQTRPVSIENTIEFRMAKAFERLLPQARVFAPGSVSIWMNSFTDSPQMVGCCDQSVPAIQQRLAFYTIYSDTNAGARAAEVSLLWLKAYGVDAIGASGPKSSEFFKPFAHPRKFEGVLPELWRDGDDVIYRVPRRSAERATSLAHVILAGQQVQRSPQHGLDTEPLQAYVAALDDPTLPAAEMRWVSPHSLEIHAVMPKDGLISVQSSYAPGWRAVANGRPAKVRSDALGLLLIEPDCAGPCSVQLAYEGVPERNSARAAQISAALGCILWLLKFWILRRPNHSTA